MEASQYRVGGFILPQPGLLAKTISVAWTFVLQEIHVQENLLNVQLAKYSWCQFACAVKWCLDVKFNLCSNVCATV